MSSSDSLKSTPLKSKRSLNLTSESPVSKTPEKHAGQLHNRGVPLSVKEVREVAQTELGPPTESVKSARKQIWSAEPPPCKTSGGHPDKLPEKYQILCEFFDSLDSAIRLLKMKGSVQTFTNVSPKIERLTDRRFSYGHLAQLKHILPEGVEIKRMLIFDEKTSCMKPDLHISIILDAIDYGDKLKSESKNQNLRRVFRARLADFLNAHPERDEVPESDLPEPFNRSKQTLQLNVINNPMPSSTTLTEQQSLMANAEVIQEEAPAQPDLSNFNSEPAMETLADVANEQLPAVASHVSPFFRKRFSNRAAKAQGTLEKCLEVSLQSSNIQVPEPCTLSEKGSSGPTQSKPEALLQPTSSEKSSKTCLPPTPIKVTSSLKIEDGSPTKAGSIKSTPAKLVSTPARLMTATPTLQPKKRCYMSPDEDSCSSSSKLIRRPQRPRSLIFDTPVKEEKVVDEVHQIADKLVDNEDDCLSILHEDDCLSILPKSLLHSIREKERQAMEERDPAISQAKRRQHMVACLPKLFNTIHYLFQSLNRTVITKEEIMHKIIAGHCDIVDRGEVEEQLNLLLELAPEWISEKVASAGDLLVCIDKAKSPESIRMRLQESK